MTAWRWLIGAAVAAAIEGVAVLAFTMAVSAPAQAQWFDQQSQRRQYQRPQNDGGFFGGLFGGGGWRHQREPARRSRSPAESQHHADYSHAPPPRKQESQPDPNKPVTSIVVMGGSMADWLAYGLEDAFADSPNIEVVRKDKPGSGLLRYQYKSDLDWWHVAREELAKQKANYVVMMLGVTDRLNIRESDVAKEAEKAAQEQQAAEGAAKTDQDKAADQAKDKEKDKPKPKNARGVIEFRSDQWAKVYSRRIDETIAALKSRGVPVFWVGLPSIRGTKSTADAVYLNNLFRARAQRAGVTYIDVWDGFVDDAGKYSSYGPDYEGQTRRLRSGDGVFFTQYGARKLAHYVEREIRRYMSNRVTTLNLPSAPFGPTPGGKSAVRPLAGPVLPLTTTPGDADVLLGGAGMRPARSDAVASSVLVKGDALSAPAGRADDFKWPPESSDYGKPPAPPPAAKEPAKTGPAAAAPMPIAPAVAATPAPPQQAVAPAPSAPPAQAKAAPVAPPPAASAPVAAAPTSIVAPEPEQAAATEKPAAGEAKAKAEAQAKAEAEAKKQAAEKAQAEARKRAAERARAEARRSAEERSVRRQTLRPPARVDTRRQQTQRRQPPRRRPNDPIGELFGFLPR